MTDVEKRAGIEEIQIRGHVGVIIAFLYQRVEYVSVGKEGSLEYNSC